MKTCIILLLIAAIVFPSEGANTNKVDKADKERKAEHQANKIIVESRDKGSAGPWTTEREYPLMFSNNTKANKSKKGTQQ